MLTLLNLLSLNSIFLLFLRLVSDFSYFPYIFLLCLLELSPGPPQMPHYESNVVLCPFFLKKITSVYMGFQCIVKRWEKKLSIEHKENFKKFTIVKVKLVD